MMATPGAAAAGRNTSPCRQKAAKTKPRGSDEEETAAAFARSAPAEVAMDDGVWAQLPDDLILEVLARVPPFHLFRLRPVCRRWNSILHDPGFLNPHSRAPSHGPCLLTFWRTPAAHHHHCSVFTSPLKAWYKIPLWFLPPWAFWLVGSSEGLVCFAGSDGASFRILVCNPLTRAWRALPVMHFNLNHHRQFALVASRRDRWFKVIAGSDVYGDKMAPVEVYDSRLDSWSLHRMSPDPTTTTTTTTAVAMSLSSSKMAVCRSGLYLETLSPLGLMMYHVDQRRWEHIRAKFPRSLLDSYLVAGAGDRLFLVGRIGLYSTLQSMRVWELNHGRNVWVEISRMPPKYFRALLRLSGERFECFGQDNMICFTSWNQGKGLLFDVDRKAWSWVAGCALQLCSSQVTFYEPRFDASVY